MGGGRGPAGKAGEAMSEVVRKMFGNSVVDGCCLINRRVGHQGMNRRKGAMLDMGGGRGPAGKAG